jgi:two-component system, NtrC family, response regulator HydG
MSESQILILDDDVDVLNAARLLLKQHVDTVDFERNPKYLPEMIRSNRYDALLLDMNYTGDFSSGEEGFRLLAQVQEIDPALSVILITAYGDIEKAVKAVKQGASDFVLKPWQNEKLVATVSNAINLTKSRRKVEKLLLQQQEINGQNSSRYPRIIGESEAMKEIFTTIDKVAATDANVMILGENGTGKELVARAIHRQSHRANEIFLSVDMGTIPENLFESELFGYMPGAFTDAQKRKPDALNWQAAAPCFSMKSVTFRYRCSPNFYRCLKPGKFPAWAQLMCLISISG